VPKLYHVDRLGKLQAGQQVELQFKDAATQHRTNRAELLSELYSEGISQHGWEYLLKENRGDPKQDTSGTIELLAEMVRASRFPEKPSRFQSFFCFRTLSEARRFAQSHQILVPASGRPAVASTIYEVESAPSVFVADMALLGLGACWVEALLYLTWYWQGKPSKNPQWEVLVPLPATVTRTVKGNKR
jgi:hypothetical protein